MPIRLRLLASAGAIVGLIGAVQTLGAQDPFYLKYNSGQAVQPIFEGWSKSPDGGFTMHFGYLNRNFVETVSLPVGPDNSIQPGGPDRGQPTFFYPRISRNQFGVSVPKDWGKKELVWTVAVHGSTEKAIGWLQPEWEIDPVRGGRATGAGPANQPPVLALDPVRQPITSTIATLSASVTDDGLPKPRGRGKPAVGQETPPILQGSADAPVNVPQVAGRGRNLAAFGRPQGLSLAWIVWRGPAAATFEPGAAPVKDGKATVTATFTKPGEYVLRARATDGELTTEQDLKLSVTAGKP